MKSIQRTSASFLLRTVFLLSLLMLSTLSLRAQLSLSGGVSLGYAANLTYGERDDNGTLANIFADLQYKRIIGRIQYTGLLAGSFASENIESGFGVHGSLGYNIPITEQLHLPVMLSGGAAVITYNNGFNGSINGSGSIFTDANPQFGVTLAPYFMLTEHLSVTSSLRFLRGFTVSEESETINLTDLALGIRYTF